MNIFECSAWSSFGKLDRRYDDNTGSVAKLSNIIFKNLVYHLFLVFLPFFMKSLDNLGIVLKSLTYIIFVFVINR